ncbi:MAG: glucose-6-phosphate isomerase [Alphaproteobacteria bacterium]|nr:glucose-6-phosphate isomerase [Alphaproteobacteria bacterium]
MTHLDKIWQNLAHQQQNLAQKRIAQLFDENSARFAEFTAKFTPNSEDKTDSPLIWLDYSKILLDKAARAELLELATESGLGDKRQNLFSGTAINQTENRSVLHMALRGEAGDFYATESSPAQNLMPMVIAERDRFLEFADSVIAGRHRGSRGDKIRHVVNIGIGGSDLGPQMAVRALAGFHLPDAPTLHFVSNVDPAHWLDAVRGLNPSETLVIIASKTFTTSETMTNARAARAWLADAVGEANISAHLVALSTNDELVRQFGIASERIFGFWDWVGGRYSLWSSIGLSLAMSIGRENFRQFLAGARAMDQHFLNTDFADNLPVILGLIGVWHRNMCGYTSRAVIPYSERLARLPAYLQQLDMESNGKSVTLAGQPIQRATGPVVWGEPGTNAQHAFFQLLHQGSDIIPVEFILPIDTTRDAASAMSPAQLQEQQNLLIANCLAQSEALAAGDAQPHDPARHFPGNRPSVTILLRRLDPYHLGMLIALYEHRVFVEGAIWEINSFDQFGVELGKKLALRILPALQSDQAASSALSHSVLEAVREVRQ